MIRRLVIIAFALMLADVGACVALAKDQSPTPDLLQIVPTQSPTPAPTPTATPSPLGPQGDSYTDPKYGWSIKWDPNAWSASVDEGSLSLEVNTSSGYGWTFVLGAIDDSEATTTTFDLSKPESCLASIESEGTVQYGPGHKPLRGVTSDRAWGVYGVGDRGVYIDCRVLVRGKALLGILGKGKLAEFNEIAPKLQDLLTKLQLPKTG